MRQFQIVLLLLSLSSTACLHIEKISPSPPTNSSSLSMPSLTPSLSPLRITILNVGQGDASFIQTPNGKTILIDAGRDGKGKEVILPFLDSQQVSHLDAIIATHYDADHIGGIDEVIVGKDGKKNTTDDFRPIDGVYDRGREPFDESPFFPQYLQAIVDFRNMLRTGEELSLDPTIHIRCVSSNGEISGNPPLNFESNFSQKENAASIGLLIEYGKFKYLTSGDLTGGGNPGGYETADLETALGTSVGKVSALHVNHHGSLTSSNASFVENTRPLIAIINTGDNNDYHHPAQETLEKWRNVGADLWLTEKGSGGFIVGEQVVNGNIVLETDGNSMKVNGQGYKL